MMFRFLCVTESKKTRKFCCLLMLCLCLTINSSPICADEHNYGELFEEIYTLVEKNFYNPLLLQEKLNTKVDVYRNKAVSTVEHSEFAALINDMLSSLNTSHTYYLTPADYEYYHLAGIFSFLPPIKTLFNNQEITYPTVGIITVNLEGRTFIATTLAGGVADKAGLLAGDEIVSVNGEKFQPIASIKSHLDNPVVFAIKRSAGSEIQSFTLVPELVNPKAEMLAAVKASVRVLEKQGKKIGYIHLYSYAGKEYHDELISAISYGALVDVDALIVDLRYGLGGANPDYLNMFNTKVPVMTSVDNTGKIFLYDPQFRKPAVYLVNGYTRSGKEILAYGAKKYKLATVIGERTAGAATGAQLLTISNGDLLYLAGRSSLVDGDNLEGVGVEPDIAIEIDIRYAKGQDIQLDTAISHLLKIL